LEECTLANPDLFPSAAYTKAFILIVLSTICMSQH